MQRSLSLGLALLMLLTALPLSSLAEAQSNALITWSKIASAAISLAGYDENAAPYYSRMPLSAAMNATQVIGYLDELLCHKLPGTANTVQMGSVRLERLKQSNMAAYQTLDQVSIAQFHRVSTDVRTLLSELQGYRERLSQAVNFIEANHDIPYDENYNPSQQVYYSMKLRECYEYLQNVLPVVLSKADAWENQIRTSQNALGLVTSSAIGGLPALLEDLCELSGENVIKEIELDAAAMNVTAPPPVCSALWKERSLGWRKRSM